MRKIAALILFLSLATAAWAQPKQWPASAAGKTTAGYVLLDRILVMFQQLAESGAGGKDKVDQGLEGIMGEAVQAKSKNQIDPIFFHRFNRLLSVMKLSLVLDNKGILKAHIQKTFADFVEDVLGEIPASAEKESQIPIGLLAGSLAEEIINLRIYLDTKDQRQKLLDEWMNAFTVGKK